MAEAYSVKDKFNNQQRWALGDGDDLMVSRPGSFPPKASIRLHSDCWADFDLLAAAASEAGFELCIASGYRSFDRQLAIWNSKLSGRRALLDDEGKPLSLGDLSIAEQVQAVLRFSALPGASRHHWGSDFDVFDAASLPEGYTLQLTPQEYQAGGVQGAFGDWLDKQLSPEHGGREMAQLFCRPYCLEVGGIAVEPWHLSHRSLAADVEKTCSLALLFRRLHGADMIHRDYVLAELPALWQRYVQPYMSGSQHE